MIDLRSDTVTKPTPAMRRAMAEAEVGDDVFGEDPTVNKLQEYAAQLFGREAALFVPSGTMGNQIAIKVHTQPGDEVIVEEASHIFNSEMAMMSAFAGVLPRPIPSERGFLRWEQIERAIRPNVYYYAQTRLICLENTHNLKGGGVYPLEWAREIVENAHQRGLAVHLDGARIFNAALATGRSVKEITEGFDSVMFCLSKGLGAPAGSMLVGSREFIEKARRVRKMLGGGMRQVGVLAAAGLYALEHHVARLAEDHKNAQLLAEALQEIPEVHLEPVETNIVIFELSTIPAEKLIDELKQRDILALAIGPRRIRLVTHLDVSREDVLYAAQAIREILKQ
ncbi:MAG: low-specificity L-threonine aldolase [Candidatus Bipolaricaulota bacterium]|nr:low-specificity L-threonine aldolase [Candidatus Bipolaricaulota bacterium]MDW8030383.1 low-specificity L-threonine aldolase [Candidatus Bipolaricaulota bacterium]